jgi:hypothetical protein
MVTLTAQRRHSKAILIPLLGSSYISKRPHEGFFEFDSLFSVLIIVSVLFLPSFLSTITPFSVHSDTYLYQHHPQQQNIDSIKAVYQSLS